jgi:HAD superfamily hydrolase (TIGR01509 family)
MPPRPPRLSFCSSNSLMRKTPPPHAKGTARLPPITAVIFDLDGTITRPILDFDAIRAELRLPPGPLLETMETMPAHQRARAEQVLQRHEDHAARNSQLHDGAAQVLQALHASGRRLAILTRNSRRSAQTVIDRHNLGGFFQVVWTREDGPIKPSPEPVLQICQRLGVPPQQACLVGDHPFDVLAGRAAGARTVLLVSDAQEPNGGHQADHVIRQFTQLLELLPS